MVRTIKLKNLNLNPLSVAKYFYEKENIDDYALIQDFLYLTYREILKKENRILFKEKFQAWEGGPFLESVYRQMKLNFNEHESLDCLFEAVEDIKDKIVRSYLTKVHRDYQNSKKKGGEIDFFFQTQDASWEQVREKVNGERTPHIFIEPSRIAVN